MNGSNVDPDVAVATDPAAALIAFVRGRDIPCPLCGYNLRDLVAPRCPECDEQLRLAVGLVEQRIAPYLLTIAPCLAAGGSALVIGALVLRFGSAPFGVLAWTIGATLSGLVGVALLSLRRRFMRRSARFQWMAALLAWLVHAAVFVAFVATLR